MDTNETFPNKSIAKAPKKNRMLWHKKNCFVLNLTKDRFFESKLRPVDKTTLSDKRK